MDKKQKQILDAANKKQLKNEKVLTGGARYTNPSKKGQKGKKNKNWLDRLFS